MKKHPLEAAVAALNNQTNAAVVGIVACSLSLEQAGAVQLLPDGLFKAKDGRPFDVPGGQWLLDDTAWQAIQAAAAERSNDYHFDYEHQTLRTSDNGQPAPAAGWVKPSALRYVPGQGLFADGVEWTKNAAQMIRDKEYRYTSAVFAYDKASGRPLALLHIALTNDPALDGMKAIAALKASFNPTTHHGDPAMNEALRLLAALGVSTEGIDPADAAACKTAVDQGTAAITALKAKADKTGPLETEVAALKAKTGPDMSQFVPKDVHAEALQQLAALSAQHGTVTLDATMEAATKAGKVFGEKDKAYLLALGKTQGVAALKAVVDERPAIAALTTTQTTAKPPEGEDTAIAALTAEDKKFADAIGCSYEEFAKAKAEQNKE
ncbi:phage protease [Gallaecimonas kandeliae]|uniref:phage protease n=1 Tax=Gallaecimonas kandeliae TaxID=3029055 RepID=UPI0026482C2C|nr:phage protease [Gallaecimonas kandeliae]WKE64340.1 phage protease [Gallaecimonas kandeliae]